MKIAIKIPMINSFKLCLYGVFISLFILSCGADASTTGTNTPGTQYTVTFDTGGGSAVTNQEVTSGANVTKPADPTSNGYTFTGWYKDSQFTTEFDFDSETITADITLYAKWTATYTVTFDLNGGTGSVPAQDIVSGNMATKPTDPTRTDYRFAGWYTTQTATDTEFNFQNTAISEAITLYAKWTATYTVTFDLNGGTGNVPAQDIVSGSMATKPIDPTRTDYRFAGWYTTQTATDTEFNFQNTAITEAITLYAKWTATYTVTFDLRGGAGNTPAQNIVSGGMAVEPATPALVGYTFDGWYTSKTPTDSDTEFNFQSTAITEAITLYAKWEAIVYSVTFDLNGGTGSVPAQDIVSGSMATKPTDPTRTGYTFDGWYTSKTPTDNDMEFNFRGGSVIRETTTLYAIWTRNTYTITFDLNYTGSPTATTETTDDTGKVTQLDPTRPNYNFVGWYTNAAGTGTVVDLGTREFLVDTTLYAKWTTKFTVNFVVDGGSTINPLEVDPGASVSRPTDPTRTGHTFENWYKNQDLTQLFDFGSETIATNTSIYAKWTINTYTVTFDADGGEPEPPPSSVNYKGVVSEPPTLSKTSYSFDGWYANKGKTTPFSFSSVITNNTTLYAKWTRNPYTVTFDMDGGKSQLPQTINHGDTATEPSDPTRIAHTFDGWYANAAKTTPFSFSSAITNNTIIYAKWIRNAYTVTFYLNYQGSPTASTAITDATGKVTAPDPTRTGYTFTGWNIHSQGTGRVIDLATESFTTDEILFARWTINTYTVSFDVDGGTPQPAPQQVDYGSKANQPSNLSKADYALAGWYSDAAKTVSFSFTNVITQDMTLYAKWTKTFSVTFNQNYIGAPAVTTATTDAKGKVAEEKNPIRTGYNFDGWYENAAGTGTAVDLATKVFTTDTTLYAKWVNSGSATFTHRGIHEAIVSISLSEAGDYGFVVSKSETAPAYSSVKDKPTFYVRTLAANTPKLLYLSTTDKTPEDGALTTATVTGTTQQFPNNDTQFLAANTVYYLHIYKLPAGTVVSKHEFRTAANPTAAELTASTTREQATRAVKLNTMPGKDTEITIRKDELFILPMRFAKGSGDQSGEFFLGSVKMATTVLDSGNTAREELTILTTFAKGKVDASSNYLDALLVFSNAAEFKNPQKMALQVELNGNTTYYFTFVEETVAE